CARGIYYDYGVDYW
nr:immunoglobulin heavy chain junction region [Mus musculus]